MVVFTAVSHGEGVRSSTLRRAASLVRWAPSCASQTAPAPRPTPSQQGPVSHALRLRLREPHRVYVGSGQKTFNPLVGIFLITKTFVSDFLDLHEKYFFSFAAVVNMKSDIQHIRWVCGGDKAAHLGACVSELKTGTARTVVWLSKRKPAPVCACHSEDPNGAQQSHQNGSVLGKCGVCYHVFLLSYSGGECEVALLIQLLFWIQFSDLH